MKKLYIILFISLIGLASCKKDYSCTCVTTVNGTPEAPVTYSYENVTKSTAHTKCFENATTTSGYSFNKTTECTFN